MKKYVPLMLMLMAGVFMETRSAAGPENPEPGKPMVGLRSGSATGASGKIAILCLPE